MATMGIQMNGDGCWPDLKHKPHINAMGNDTRVDLAVLHNGTEGGRVSITFRVDTPDGQTILFETTWRLLKSAVEAIAVQLGEEANL